MGFLQLSISASNYRSGFAQSCLVRERDTSIRDDVLLELKSDPEISSEFEEAPQLNAARRRTNYHLERLSDGGVVTGFTTLGKVLFTRTYIRISGGSFPRLRLNA